MPYIITQHVGSELLGTALPFQKSCFACCDNISDKVRKAKYGKSSLTRQESCVTSNQNRTWDLLLLLSVTFMFPQLLYPARFSPAPAWASHVAPHTCALSLSWACRCDPRQTGLYSEMLLTDRFHSSHRLEWFCLFLGCGLGQWLVLNSRCFSSGGCNQSARCRGRQKRAM